MILLQRLRRGVRACRSWPLLLCLLLSAQPASAALSKSQLDAVTGSAPAQASVPLDLGLINASGKQVSLRSALGGRPALLMLADYRCTQLCGSILGIAAQALHGSGLRPDQDFTLAVVGFNPDATAADGQALGQAEIGAYPELAADARLLTGPAEAVEQLERSVGFTAVRDAEAGRFAHPADLYVLTAAGRVSRVLNGLSLEPETVRLALVEAGQGRIGSLVDRLHVLCYGLDPLSGASTGLAQTMLRAGGSLTLAIAGWVLLRRLKRAGRPT